MDDVEILTHTLWERKYHVDTEVPEKGDVL